MVQTSSVNGARPAARGSVAERLVQLGADMRDITRVKRRYPMKISQYYLGLIEAKDDPIWRQCVPSIEEFQDEVNVEDPLHEEEHAKTPYLVHKYPDRVLLLVSNKCAMFCRFCTRKRKVGRTTQIPMDEIMRSIDYIRDHPEVRDIIVSGGDPLTRTDRDIERILGALRAIPHVEVIRIGTRMPCVDPKRITKRLVNMLKKYHPLYMNIHFNHPREVTPEVAQACGMLADAGIPMGSQTVLLRGVNDSPEVMTELMHRLLAVRVKPYYIYQCDLVRGAEHFRTSMAEGLNVIKRMQGYTSGLCVPHFVVDTAGGKIPVSPQYVRQLRPGEAVLTNYLDEEYTVPDPAVASPPAERAPRPYRIGITFNMKRQAPGGETDDLYAEFDDPETIEAIRAAIASVGYETVLIEADDDLVEDLKRERPDFVFNIAEGLHGDARESQVPAVLDMLRIPYSGSGVLTQALTLNKARKKEVLLHNGVPTPGFRLFSSPREVNGHGLRFPLIVKPNSEGSSKGITNDSLVFDDESLKRQVTRIITNYTQPALVEEYIDGREFTVALIGNGHPRVLPIVEVTYDHLPEGVHRFDSFEAKWEYDSPERNVDPLRCPAPLGDEQRRRIEEVAVATYRVLGCVDLCRIDMRLDAEGVPHVFDVNALPGLIPDPRENSRFPRACFTAGMTYDRMVLEVLHTAMRRHGMGPEGGTT